MTQSECLAEEIAEDLLYRTGRALVDGDMRWLDDCFHLPVLVETASGKQIIRTEDGVHNTMRNVRRYLAARDVVDVVRTVVDAQFVGPNLIGSTHVSSMLRSDGSTFRAPFPVFSMIRNFEENWKIVSSTYAILDDPQHENILCQRTIDWQNVTVDGATGT